MAYALYILIFFEVKARLFTFPLVTFIFTSFDLTWDLSVQLSNQKESKTTRGMPSRIAWVYSENFRGEDFWGVYNSYETGIGACFEDLT